VRGDGAPHFLLHKKEYHRRRSAVERTILDEIKAESGDVSF
jgi:hypothetical protein